jgi:7,8-dihydropterin-6-yl-methyl-4-(beta-D-ribofuranosyl)aminobenzene 5'-phosphate synthase
MITSANGGKSVPTYMHPGMFESRAIMTPDGRLMPMEDIPGEKVLAGNGAQLIITKDEQSVLSGSFYVSGEISRVTHFERGLIGQRRLNEDGEWELDELLMDERFVAVHIAKKGLFVFTACSHAGLINVLTHASSRFPDVPIYGVFGGFHLAGPTESIIPDTIEALDKFNLEVIAAAHCTGWRAIGALETRFGNRVVPSAVGKRFLL